MSVDVTGVSATTAVSSPSVWYGINLSQTPSFSDIDDSDIVSWADITDTQSITWTELVT